MNNDMLHAGASFLELARTSDWVVIDFETTGKDYPEAVSLAVVNHSGLPLFNRRFKPCKAIEPGATRVHGITNDDIASEPPFGDCVSEIISVLEGRRVVAYNAAFDIEVLLFELRRAGSDWEPQNVHCAMSLYASYAQKVGYRGKYKWVALSEACEVHGVSATGAHDALTDCLMTVRLIGAVAVDFATKVALEVSTVLGDVKVAGGTEFTFVKSADVRYLKALTKALR